jgi:quinolinate synthase
MTGRDMILWQGHCHVHDVISTDDLAEARAAHPGAVLLAHPECRPEVLELADVVTSTSGMLREPEKNPARSFIVATETGLLYRLGQLYPDREFVPASRRAICPNMKMTTLEKCIATLGEEFGDVEQHEVQVAKPIREKALRAVERMIQ